MAHYTRVYTVEVIESGDIFLNLQERVDDQIRFEFNFENPSDMSPKDWMSLMSDSKVGERVCVSTGRGVSEFLLTPDGGLCFHVVADDEESCTTTKIYVNKEAAAAITKEISNKLKATKKYSSEV